MLRIEFNPEFERLLRFHEIPDTSSLKKNKVLKSAYSKTLNAFKKFTSNQHLPEKAYLDQIHEFIEDIAPAMQEEINTPQFEDELYYCPSLFVVLCTLQAGIYLTYVVNGHTTYNSFCFTKAQELLNAAEKITTAYPNQLLTGPDFLPFFTEIKDKLSKIVILDPRTNPGFGLISATTHDYREHLTIIERVLKNELCMPANLLIANVHQLCKSLFEKHLFHNLHIESALEIAERIRLVLAELKPLLLKTFPGNFESEAPDLKSQIFNSIFMYQFVFTQNIAAFYFHIAKSNQYKDNLDKRKEFLMHAKQALKSIPEGCPDWMYKLFTVSDQFERNLKDRVDNAFRQVLQEVLDREKDLRQAQKAEEELNQKLEEYNKNFHTLVLDLVAEFEPYKPKRSKPVSHYTLRFREFTDSESDSDSKEDTDTPAASEPPVPFHEISLEQHLKELNNIRSKNKTKKEEAEKILDIIDYYQMISSRHFNSSNLIIQNKAIQAVNSAYLYFTELKNILDRAPSAEFDELRKAYQLEKQHIDNMYSVMMHKYTKLFKILDALRNKKIQELGDSFYQKNPRHLSKEATVYWSVYRNFNTLSKLSNYHGAQDTLPARIPGIHRERPINRTPNRPTNPIPASVTTEVLDQPPTYTIYKNFYRNYFKNLFFSQDTYGEHTGATYLSDLRRRTLRRSNSESMLSVNEIEKDHLASYKLTSK